ncbi:hypothetical protein TNCV_903471 [Trichonephila clavipes]|nr:hypothetical protein TNCV_903471 [Trichonephila clavipes]
MVAWDSGGLRYRRKEFCLCVGSEKWAFEIIETKASLSLGVCGKLGDGRCKLGCRPHPLTTMVLKLRGPPPKPSCS